MLTYLSSWWDLLHAAFDVSTLCPHTFLPLIVQLRRWLMQIFYFIWIATVISFSRFLSRTCIPSGMLSALESVINWQGVELESVVVMKTQWFCCWYQIFGY